MFEKYEDQVEYVKENYLEVTDSRKDEDHWDLFCQKCKIVRGFQVVKRAVTEKSAGYGYTSFTDWEVPQAIYFRCPVCKAYKIWLVFTLFIDEKACLYKITAIPNEGLEEIVELPEKPASLRIAYKQAVRSMDANAHIAAANMFRRAVQIITRDILGAKPGKLGAELKSTVGKKFNGITVTNDFATNGYIIKEAGNQGAHPDRDIDLLDFTQKDAEDLQKIFMEMVGDLFVVPEAIKKSKEDFIKRRKIAI